MQIQRTEMLSLLSLQTKVSAELSAVSVAARKWKCSNFEATSTSWSTLSPRTSAAVCWFSSLGVGRRDLSLFFAADPQGTCSGNSRTISETTTE